MWRGRDNTRRQMQLQLKARRDIMEHLSVFLTLNFSFKVFWWKSVKVVQLNFIIKAVYSQQGSKR